MPSPKPVTPKPLTNGVTNNSKLPQLKSTSPKHMVSPLKTSSPKSPLRSNGIIQPKTVINDSDKNYSLNDSLDSGSFDQDSLETNSSFELDGLESVLQLNSKSDPFKSAEELIKEMVARLDTVITTSTLHRNPEDQCDAKFQTSKEMLTTESKHFVTASKLFVKSATESQSRLVENLTQCVVLIDRMFKIAELIAKYTPTPTQTQQLLLKVKDIGITYLQTLQAASNACGKGMHDPTMNVLMAHATSLASVLTALMKMLRVISP